MTRACFPTLAALLLLLAYVQAGSHVWEAKLQHPRAVEHEQVEVDAAGYAIRSDTTSKRINKRYVAFWPDSRVKLWPQKTVSYCFATKQGRSNLVKYVRQAANRWHDAGLHKDVYKWVEVADPGPDSCVKNPERAGILIINEQTEDQKGSSDATVGLPPVVAGKDLEYTGPNMNLRERGSIFRGTDNFVGTIAHEMGHVWGLHHEHQYRGFWNAPYNSWPGSDVFGDHFVCSNLEDYVDVFREVREGPEPDDADRLCTWESVAAKYGFSAAQLLPIKDQTKTTHPYFTGRHYSDVDWQSIMIYGSDAYSIEGTNALTRNDGQTFSFSNIPTQLDVQGIRDLYEDPAFAGVTFPTLPNSTKHPKKSLFDKMFRKTKGC